MFDKEGKVLFCINYLSKNFEFQILYGFIKPECNEVEMFLLYSEKIADTAYFDYSTHFN